MAESVREAERNRNNEVRLMSENGVFSIGESENRSGENGLNDLKSLFFLGDAENDCFSKYSVNDVGVNRASDFCSDDVDEFSSDFKGICPRNDENCRKKRCSDRYDSSESSDSGIAVSSSASSGTSDITDPGSPFSTSSDDSSSSPGKCKVQKARCKSEEKSISWPQPATGRCRSEEKNWTESSWERKQQEQQKQTQTQQSDKTEQNFIASKTDFKMAPNVPSASSPCQIWTSMTGNNSSNINNNSKNNNTANDTAHFNHFDKTQIKAISNKRLKKVDGKESTIVPLNINNNIVVNVPSPIISEIEPDLADSKRKSRSDNCEGPKVKMRRSGGFQENGKSPSDGSSKTMNSSKNGVKNQEKVSKQDKNRHQGKITEYFKSQMKSLVGSKRDFFGGSKSKCCGTDPEVTQAKKIKVVVMEEEEKRQVDVSVFVKPSSPKPIQAVMPLTESSRILLSSSSQQQQQLLSKLPKAAEILLSKQPAGTKTLFNKILENHKNRKLAESYSKCRTVPKLKSTPETEASKTSHGPPQQQQQQQKPPLPPPPPPPLPPLQQIPPCDPTSKRNNEVTEMPNSKLDESSSNLEEIKVQSKDLDSNLFRKVVSNRTEISNFELISTNCCCRTPGAAAAVAAGESTAEKSPILSAPKTIRFPPTRHDARMDKHRNARESISCRWDSCSVQSDSVSGLLEHLQTAHVVTQVSGEKFVCLWVGCKVFDQKSCSRTWLERHVLSHAGNKPFRCIVDGCGQGFSTQAILERHVNNHFAADVKKALDNSIVHKLFRRNGKKLRYRRQPWSARMFDFFDAGIMEGLEHRLVKLTQTRTGGDITDIPGKSLALTSQVVARRMTESGKQQCLLRWFPRNIVEDEWVYEEEVTKKKTVSIPSLSPSVSSSLQETLEVVARSSETYRTGRRKNKGVVVSRVVETDKKTAEPEELLSPPPPPSSSASSASEFASTASPSSPPMEKVEETKSVPLKKVPAKKVKGKVKKKKDPEENSLVKQTGIPPVTGGVPIADGTKDGILTTEKTVSLKPKEEAAPTSASLPEEMTMVPVCSPAEEVVPVPTANGILVDNTKLLAPIKTEMIMGSPLKLVTTSQYIEQPFVQTVMPVQMPVAYQIPIVKLSQTSGMFFPQMPNYIIPPSPPVLPPSPVPAFRNGFHFSTGGTIQIQASSTTLQQTTSGFVQSTNSSGFQIVHSPAAAAAAAANIQQSVLTAFQNSGIAANMNVKSPTLRLLNCQPLILSNNAKPLTNLSLTLTNVSTVSNPNASALTVPPVNLGGMPDGRKILTASPGSPATPATATTTPKKLLKQKVNILPKPNSVQNGGGIVAASGTKSKKQCLQPCRPATAAGTAT